MNRANQLEMQTLTGAWMPFGLALIAFYLRIEPDHLIHMGPKDKKREEWERPNVTLYIAVPS